MKSLLQRVGRALPSLGDSRCLRCATPWWATEAHHTMYDECRGCFPLCDACWSELSIEERVPYYGKLCEEWARQEPSNRERARLVINAVLEGK